MRWCGQSEVVPGDEGRRRSGSCACGSRSRSKSETTTRPTCEAATETTDAVGASRGGPVTGRSAATSSSSCSSSVGGSGGTTPERRFPRRSRWTSGSRTGPLGMPPASALWERTRGGAPGGGAAVAGRQAGGGGVEGGGGAGVGTGERGGWG